MHRLYFLIYEVRSMFHGRRWRNLSESNTSMLLISVNTFLKYFSGSNWLSLAVYISDNATALALASSKVDENSQFFLPITLSLTARYELLLDNSKYPLDYRKEFSSSIFQAFVIIEFGWEFSFQVKDFIDVFDYFSAKRFWGFVAAVFQKIDKIATNMSWGNGTLLY